MLRRTFLLLSYSLLSFYLALNAKENDMWVVDVSLDNGTKVNFLFSGEPEASLADDHTLSLSSSDALADWELSSVNTWTVSKDTTQTYVHSSYISDNCIITRQIDKIVVNLAVGQILYVSDENGNLVTRRRINSYEGATLWPNDIGNGFYTITVNKRSVKLRVDWIDK